MARATCSRCDRELPADANFCLACGAPVGAASPAASPDTTELLPTTAEEQAFFEFARRHRERDRRLIRLTLVLAVASLVVVIAVGLAVWWPRTGRLAAPRTSTVVSPPSARSGIADATRAPSPPPAPSAPSGSSAPLAASPTHRAPAADTPATPAEPSRPSVAAAPRSSDVETPPSLPPRDRSAAVEAPPPPALPRARRSTRPSARIEPRPLRPPVSDFASALPRPVGPPPPAIGDIELKVSADRDAGGDEAREYVVSLKDAAGAPYTGAEVMLRGRMADGHLVEAALEPEATPGVYHAYLRMTREGPHDLRLRIVRDARAVEVPLAYLHQAQ